MLLNDFHALPELRVLVLELLFELVVDELLPLGDKHPLLFALFNLDLAVFLLCEHPFLLLLLELEDAVILLLQGHLLVNLHLFLVLNDPEPPALHSLGALDHLGVVAYALVVGIGRVAPRLQGRGAAVTAVACGGVKIGVRLDGAFLHTQSELTNSISENIVSLLEGALEAGVGLAASLDVVVGWLEHAPAQLVELHQPLLLVLHVLHPDQVVGQPVLIEALKGSTRTVTIDRCYLVTRSRGLMLSWLHMLAASSVSFPSAWYTRFMLNDWDARGPIRVTSNYHN